MIDLAPNHKIGLTVSNPILLAGGTIGYGDAIHAGLDCSKLGAVVVGPLMLHSRAGSPPPRLSEVNDGFLLETGLQNRGLEATLRRLARLWSRLGCPVIVQLADNDPRHLERVVQRIGMLETLSGIELLLARDVEARRARTLIRVVIDNCDLPLWVKLPLDRAVALAPGCIHAEAVGLVVGQPVVQRHPSNPDELVTRPLFGLQAFAPMVDTLQQVNALKLPCALIACGGIHTQAHLQQAIETGADAVQIDSAVWVEPGLPTRLAQCVVAQ